MCPPTAAPTNKEPGGRRVPTALPLGAKASEGRERKKLREEGEKEREARRRENEERRREERDTERRERHGEKRDR